jgi:menaquinone-specific isochorismate synthase
VKARTIRLDRDLDPVAIGARSGMLWAREDIALAGVGEALRLPVTRPGGVEAAQAELRDLVGPDELDVPGSGPVAFGAFPFGPTLPGELVVPEVLVGRGPEGRRWLTMVDDGSNSSDEALARLSDLASDEETGPEPSRIEVDSVLPPDVWRDDVVTPVRDRIRAGELVKAVLARELVVTADRPIDVARVIRRLHERFASAIVFALDGFVGASPELLVSRSRDVVKAHPLAGTAARSSDPQVDGRLAAGLLASDKDHVEHRITIDWLLDTLLPFCSYVDAEPDPTLVSLANVHHLGTRVQGRLSSPPASVLELVEALHPTPAVGGDPQDLALELIGRHERADRGRYAGPVGWVDGNGNGAFAVAIRSAEISGPTARVFAGVGVVADSDPRAELAETRAKFQAMLGTLLEI